MTFDVATIVRIVIALVFYFIFLYILCNSVKKRFKKSLFSNEIEDKISECLFKWH